jgi:hypothetical protein
VPYERISGGDVTGGRPPTGLLAGAVRGRWFEPRAARRWGAVASLHVGWAVVAGAAVLLIGYGAAAVLATLLPVPRRTLAAGGIVVLALSAGWMGPTVVGRVARRCLPGSAGRRRTADRVSGSPVR